MKGRDESLLVRINSKGTPLYQVTEVSNGSEYTQEFPIEGRPFLLVGVFGRELCAEESQGFPARWASLFQYRAESNLGCIRCDCEVGSVTRMVEEGGCGESGLNGFKSFLAGFRPREGFWFAFETFEEGIEVVGGPRDETSIIYHPEEPL